jgi:hypothetical protein
VPVFVHITDQKQQRSIKRHGIKPGRYAGGVYCLPATADFMASHQWSRELKRFGAKNPLAVYFRVPKSTPVMAGRYSKKHKSMTAGEAAHKFHQSYNRDGFEVIITEPVPASAIIRFKRLRKPVGWRYYPEAKGVKPAYSILWRGEYGAMKTKRRLYPEILALDKKR